MEQQGDQTQLLPEDMLAGVLGRLAPRSLATARCVCKAWRGIIDARRILRADLLPLSLAGIFINFNELRYSEFFSRPPRPEGLGNRESRPVQCAMEDHCNGLVLHYNRVANPATGWTAPLPPPPPKSAGMECFVDEGYLVYDPTVSAHYQVVLIPCVPFFFCGEIPCVPYIELDIEPDEETVLDVDPAVLESEWPPSSCVQRVFWSSTKRWEERTFFREGEAAGTVASLGTECSSNKRHAVYWHDALYVHCQIGFVMRLSLSNSAYQVIKPPGDLEPESCTDLSLGKSKKGVYFALVRASHQIQVWVLTESCGHTEWVLEHDTHLKVPPPCLNHGQQGYGPWVLQEVNYNNEKYIKLSSGNDTTAVETTIEENFQWNSDDDNDDGVDTKNVVDKCNRGIYFLGFHPFKEIIFLSRNLSRGLAYNLNTSKIQDLGNLCPKYYGAIAGPRGLIEASFPYTPCWMK